MAKAIKKIAETNIVLEKMAEFGASEGANEGIRIQALDYFGSSIAGGKSNSMPVDANSGVKELKDAVEKYSVPAAAAYCAAQNKAAGYVVVSEGSEKTYASYMTCIGMIAVRHPDSIPAILKSTSDFCAGKSKEDLGGRNKLQVYYRTAAEVRDMLFPKKKDGKTPAARTPSVAEMSKPAFVKAALANTVTRGPKVPKDVTPTDPVAAMKSALHEIAAKLATDETVPANVRKALATVAKWA
jgi:hypothetical protein